jgi:hypothetical protein
MRREEFQLIAVRGVQNLGDYRLRLTFSNGAVKDIDLTAKLWGEVFEML